MPKPLLCRFGVHSWQTQRNEENVQYITCERCGKDSHKIHLNDISGGLG